MALNKPGQDSSGPLSRAGDGSGGSGLSAYQVAVQNGFVGTESEWVASLAGAPGAGWTAIPAVVPDGARLVHQVIDWTGGTGVKPPTGKYIGPSGFVDTAAEATNVKGADGVSGDGSGIQAKVFYVNGAWQYANGAAYTTHPVGVALEFFASGTPYVLPSLAADKFDPVFDFVWLPDGNTAPSVLFVVADATQPNPNLAGCTLNSEEISWLKLLQRNVDGKGGGWIRVVCHSAQNALPADVTSAYRAIIIARLLTSTNVSSIATKVRTLNMPVMWLGRSAIESFSKLGLVNGDPSGHALIRNSIDPSEFTRAVFRGEQDVLMKVINTATTVNAIPVDTLVPGVIALAHYVKDDPLSTVEPLKAAVLFAPGGVTIAPGHATLQAVLGSNAFRAHWPTNSAVDLTEKGHILFFRLLNSVMGYEDTALANTAPAAPQGLQPTDGDGFVDLKWTRNTESDLDHYQLERATVDIGPYSIITQVQQSSNATITVRDSTVVNGTVYYYRLRAVDTAGQFSAYSIGVEARPVATTVPTPASLTTRVTATTIRMSWPAVTGATSYLVQLGTNAEIDVGLALTHTFEGLAEDVRRTVTLRAKNGTAVSAPISKGDTPRRFKMAVVSNSTAETDSNYNGIYFDARDTDNWSPTFIVGTGGTSGAVDYTPYDLIVLDAGMSSSSSNIPPKNINKPMVVFEAAAVANLSLGSVNASASTDMNTIVIEDPTDAMLSPFAFAVDEAVRVFTTTDTGQQNTTRIAITDLPTGAKVLATHGGLPQALTPVAPNPGAATLVSYPEGTTLSDAATVLTHRRVLAWFNTTPSRYNTAATRSLFKAMINWALAYNGDTVHA